jgi:flavin-dependent dehydrogenase
VGVIDAIVVGAGIAGAACALELGRKGARVLLIERTPAPQPKVCGEFLSGECEALLAHLGVDPWRLGAAALNTLTLEAAGFSATMGLPFRAAGLSRQCLDETLLGAARRAGVEVLRGATVRSLRPGASGIAVSAGSHTYTARAAVLATGKHDLRGWRRPLGGLSAFKQQYVVGPSAIRMLENRVLLVLYDGGYLGACLVEKRVATLCWLADEGLMQATRGRWVAQLESLAARSPRLRELLADARPLFGRPAAVADIPFGWRRRTPVDNAVYAIGDQLAVIPSFAGDGTALALASAVAAAQAVLEGEPAGRYQAAFIASSARQFRWAGALDWCLRRPLPQRMAVMALALTPGAGRRLALMTRTSHPQSPDVLTGST